MKYLVFSITKNFYDGAHWIPLHNMFHILSADYRFELKKNYNMK